MNSTETQIVYRQEDYSDHANYLVVDITVRLPEMSSEDFTELTKHVNAIKKVVEKYKEKGKK
jgi:hypothetical protein